MYCSVLSATVSGMEMIPVQVEADVSDGMPQFTMVGYVSAQVKEAQDRVRTALKNMGISLPPKRITINLSPADVRKEGSRFDLPIAAGVLMTLGRIPPGSLRKTMVLGELGLDGHVQEISGVFPAAAKARELGCTTLLVPAGNAAEGGLVGGLHVVGIQNLQELLNYCCEGKMPSLPSIENQKKEDGKEPDFSEVQGQTAARRAALIAAAGFHNLLMLGPPGSGKSMIARRIPTIMPPMSEEEQMEVTRIYSIAGMLAKGEGVRRERPFRAPHHTMSPQALAGGGKQPSPGEITLAHRGVLFLDELPEMTRTTIEILRQPLEEHRIVISRVSGNYVFPASFLMVAAMNPCPCGFYPDLSRCTCAPGDISRYLSRVSQPFLDRMDLCVQVEALSYEDLHGEERCESSAKMREKATAAAEIQAARYRQEGYPERLMPFADMPSRLFVRGALPADEQKTAAIVGARICTAYGKSQAAFFAQVLAANGVAVISGLACGIDAAAHEGALRGKGKTFAVLGCGVDICYPKQNYPLMRRMLENGGGVLSEFPPGAEPLPWHFPIRNRVISALADVVLVIEAKEKSGSLITADYALEQGKTVFALPGRTTDATSRGCNRLIAQGAEIAISPETILEELGVKKAGTKRAAPRPRYGKEAEMVLKTLAAEPQNLAQLAGSTGIPLQELTGILLALEIDGVIAENPPGVYMALL